MKEILRVARFDFLTAGPTMLAAYGLICLMALVIGLFFSPLMYAVMLILAPLFVIPLESFAERSEFRKLYGILPVRRKSITRGRFLFLYLCHFVPEILALLLVRLSVILQLWRFLPAVSSDMKSIIEETFDPKSTQIFTIMIGIFTVICVMFSYMQMMGQIFGLENEMKIIMGTLTVITVVCIAFFTLSEHGIIPQLQVPDSTRLSAAQAIRFGIVCNLGVAALNKIFCEITAAKVAKREL